MRNQGRAPRVALAPEGLRLFLKQAVVEGGGVVVDPSQAEGLIWASPAEADALRALLVSYPDIRWVQLPWAGIEPFVDVLDRAHMWSGGQDVYSEPVAEHALALTLAGLRDMKKRALSTSWDPPSGRSLFGARVTVVGAGGIVRVLSRLLRPFACELTVVRRRADPFEGAAHTLPMSRLDQALMGADVVILACALTRETVHCINARALACMSRHAWLVNVGRGGLVDTPALVKALESDAIGGAALDVTDPEPLPTGHALWALANCIITPHTANTPDMAVPVLSRRIRENVRRFAAGDPLLGMIDIDAGY